MAAAATAPCFSMLAYIQESPWPALSSMLQVVIVGDLRLHILLSRLGSDPKVELTNKEYMVDLAIALVRLDAMKRPGNQSILEKKTGVFAIYRVCNTDTDTITQSYRVILSVLIVFKLTLSRRHSRFALLASFYLES